MTPFGFVLGIAVATLSTACPKAQETEVLPGMIMDQAVANNTAWDYAELYTLLGSRLGIYYNHAERPIPIIRIVAFIGLHPGIWFLRVATGKICRVSRIVVMN